MGISGVTASAVSALTANAARVAAVADNVANVGTVGFKATEVRTTTLVTRQAAGGGFAAGGVQTVARPSVAVQGVLESTNSPTDLAVAGNGLFPVEGPAGGEKGRQPVPSWPKRKAWGWRISAMISRESASLGPGRLK